MFAMKTILFPTDFSEQAGYAFGLACVLARDHGAGLVVLHVEPSPMVVLGGTVALPPLPEEHWRDEVQAKLKEYQPPPGVPAEYRFEEGDPSEIILRVARESDCDLVVMGTHGRGPVTRFLLGSVAERVVRKAPCPVLTVRAPVGAAAHAPEECAAAAPAQ
jgi:nucleotide-binding universal stress UspA family protein